MALRLACRRHVSDDRRRSNGLQLAPPTPLPTPPRPTPPTGGHISSIPAAGAQEISGYIDLNQRLTGDEAGMAAVFALERRLLPHPTDLSYFNWTSNTLSSSSSPNFEASAAG